jgi:hypothetical protein
MNVYFSANARDLESYDLYRHIVKAIQTEGGIIIYGWLEVSALRGGLPGNDVDWWNNMPSEAIAGIKDADVVIVEATGQSSLGVGYEMTTALTWGKPVLALVNKDFVGGSYIQGIKHSLLSFQYYESHNLARIVKRFLKLSIESER